MDISLSINCDFESVFLINGNLIEGGEIVYAENEVVYLTVLPLSAMLLPYTVKLVGGAIKSNEELAKCYNLGAGKFYLKLLARFNYVYSIPSTKKTETGDLIEKFFKCVIENRIQDARSCLSQELSESIDDQSLLAFFDGYNDIIADDRTKGLYYLIDQTQNGTLYNFSLKYGVIDNIIEF